MASDPIIFHDYLLGVEPWYRTLLEKREAGKITDDDFQREFFMPGIGFHRSLWLAMLALVQYRAWGRQTFCIGPKLQAMFDATSLEGVDADEVKLPYPAFYIALPDCAWQVWGGHVTEWHQVTGVLVRQIDREGKAPAVFFYVWGAENDQSRRPGDDASFWFTMDLQEVIDREMDLEAYITTILSDDARDSGSGDYAPWASALGEGWNELPKSGTDLRAAWVDQALHVIRVALNMTIYVNSQGPEITPDERAEREKARKKALEEAIKRKKNKTKRRRLERQLDDIDPIATHNVVWLGKSIENSTRAPSIRGPQGARRHTWVRGHWWPRLSTLRAQNKQAQARLDEASQQIIDAKKVIDETTDPAALVAAAGVLRKASELALSLKEKLTKVVQGGKRKRRWVQPYERNKDQKGKVESHVYQFREETDEVPKPDKEGDSSDDAAAK
jgi:hypothetical protein